MAENYRYCMSFANWQNRGKQYFTRG